MSSPRVQKIFQALPDQLKRLGGYTWNYATVLRWAGRDTAGNDACLIDLDAQAWVTGNRRAIIVAKAATTTPDIPALHTQSHAIGHQIDGSVSLEVVAETPASWTGEHARFLRLLQHALMGQLGAPVEILLTANADEPTVAGVNGASTSEATASTGKMWPYGPVASAPGGI